MPNDVNKISTPKNLDEFLNLIKNSQDKIKLQVKVSANSKKN